MNITRMGHYHTPSGEGEKGSCQAAIVTHTSDYDAFEGAPRPDVWVNLLVFGHGGDPIGNRTEVKVSEPREFATFHLSPDCPWGR